MTILITGANRGIGRALFDGYSTTGDAVIGTTRAAAPEDGLWETLDVAAPGSQAALAGRLGGQPLDLLVCNAGIYPDKGHDLAAGYPADMWAEAFATNVTGVFLTIQSLLPNLRAAKGKIAIISSMMASQELAPGGSYIYRASKAAVLNLGRNLAQDLKGDGIAVGIYHPGWVRTDMGGDAAQIDVDEARDGLMARFAALSMGSTGCFETWDGKVHPF
ncbi:SDR family NAD(P)-dependent oxidoreductase [Aliiroseovarius subalbicans]|uniref:SDR family NAD(P)-dependent oxidoreductase n=1 Tax=Aliiroseovarius subalbicans TaxID=2925840 RepID=UPI001F56931E|nr:SDR family NAD(P)-dependent oxidoreductase [Aliiroseovarius subalbicans]MCI2398895.1 SDR family NAD(P)-dependent oxidoreductase [Aliiroseovarius subalbicans]